MTSHGTQRILPGAGPLLPEMPLPPMPPPEFDPPAVTYFIEYGYRSDNGPRHVGPFATQGLARDHAWSQARPGWTSAYNIVRLTPPEEDHP